MKTFRIELTFLDKSGVHHYKIVDVCGDSITDAGGLVKEIIESYEDKNDWDYVGSSLLEASGEQKR